MKEVKKNTRGAILQAAEAEFLEKGFDGTTTTAIAARAGVTHAMLHYYFHTKEALFNGIYETKLREMLASVWQAFARPDLPFRERLVEGISIHFDFVRKNPTLPGFLLREGLLRPGRIQRLQAALVESAGGRVAVVQQEMDRLAGQGEICRMSFVDLLLDIVSLNVFVVMARPLAEAFARVRPGESEAFLEGRKQENIETILRRLRP